MAYWTHYWKNDTVTNRENQNRIDDVIGHTADNAFVKRGVTPGDTVYIVSVPEGRVQLVGRLVVDKILDQRGADSHFGGQPWMANDHLIARVPYSPCGFDVFVPHDQLKAIEFLTAGGVEPIKFDQRKGADPHAVDRQTLRGVRKITSKTARLFDSLL